MREIKFRAWDYENKKMRKVLTIAFAELSGMNIEIQGLIGYHFLDTPHHDKILFELMQYTGLKDKNGKEIYEGDIMCFKCEKHNNDGGIILGSEDYYSENSVQIIFKNGRFIGESTKGFSREMYDLIDTKYMQWEVIGNIYENPELLKD